MSTKGLEKKYVLDTSAFLTNYIRDENQGLEPAVKQLLETFEEANRKKGLEFYMPPSTFAELRKILRSNNVEEEVIESLEAWVSKKSPSRFEVSVPGEVVANFIEDMRERVNKGLRDAEKAVRELEDTEEPEKEHYTAEDVVISDLRDKYKETMRKGILDSREDLDMILLARELDATLVTEDKGVIEWSEDFGISYVKGRNLPKVLEEYLEQ
ncbi:MAG: RNA ligase partner protein [Candidatus Nanohalobium sp.]